MVIETKKSKEIEQDRRLERLVQKICFYLFFKFYLFNKLFNIDIYNS